MPWLAALPRMLRNLGSVYRSTSLFVHCRFIVIVHGRFIVIVHGRFIVIVHCYWVLWVHCYGSYFMVALLVNENNSNIV